VHQHGPSSQDSSSRTKRGRSARHTPRVIFIEPGLIFEVTTIDDINDSV
jgi:hypothetical protein